MTAPVYTNDLNLFDDFEGTAPTMSEFTGYTAGRGQAVSTDYPIQGSKHSDTVMNATGQASCSVDYGSNISGWVSGWAFFSWLVWTAPGAIATQANGGFVFIVGSSLSAFDGWYVGGNDFGSYPYGGWQNFAVDPEIGYSERTGGGPGTSDRYAGLGVDVTPTAVAKGSPLGIDVIRYGRGTFRVVYGSLGDGYASFAGMAAANDASTARWGLFQEIEGGYKWKGLMYFGYGAATEFTDLNRNIVIDNTEFVVSSFNRIEVHNASSIINWTNINISALGTVSKGEFEMIDDAEVNMTTCVFTDMSTFIFDSNATLVNVTFRRCGLITQAEADIDNCTFDEASGAIALTADDPDNIDNCTFNSDGTGHAIEIAPVGAGPFTFTLTGNYFNDYAASDGSTGNEAILINPDTSSADITLYTSGGNTPSIMEHASYTGTFTLIPDPVDIYVKAITATGVEVQDARVLLRAKDGTGPFPFNVTVTIANSGTLATVTHGTHGMATGDKVQISGASLAANNGIFAITYIGVGSYSYTMGSTPGSSPTGTIKCTFVALSGLTDSNGEIETSRVYSSDQPVIGWARKSTSTPLYKSAPLVGVVDDINGFTGTGVLILDE